MRDFKGENILHWITQFEVTFLTEMHFTKGQKFSIPGYKSYHNPFSTVFDKKCRWGISCLISFNILEHVIDINCNFEHLVVTIGSLALTYHQKTHYIFRRITFIIYQTFLLPKTVNIFVLVAET